MRSANATQAVAAGQTLFATAPLVNGAVAYAWYVGAAGSETLQAITTINSAAFNAPLTTGQQAATAITADNSRNADARLRRPADRRLQSGDQHSYVQALASGTAGTGTFLTPSGRGSIVEIDNMLLQMWNSYRLSPTVIYVNAQEQKNITAKCLTNASGPLVRYNVDASQSAALRVHRLGRRALVLQSVHRRRDPADRPSRPAAGNDPRVLRAPAGWYQSNETPNVAEVLTRRDYYRVDWPVRTRRREFGVYAEEVLAVYAPFGIGIITNIGNG